MKYTVKIETYKPKKANKTKSATKRKYMSMIVNEKKTAALRLESL